MDPQGSSLGTQTNGFARLSLRHHLDRTLLFSLLHVAQSASLADEIFK